MHEPQEKAQTPSKPAPPWKRTSPEERRAAWGAFLIRKERERKERERQGSSK